MINVRIYWDFFSCFPPASQARRVTSREKCVACVAPSGGLKSLLIFTVGLHEKLSLFGKCVSEYRCFVSVNMGHDPVTVCVLQAAEVERQLSTQVHSLRDDFREKSMSTSQHMTRLESLQAEVRPATAGWGGVVVGERCTYGPM